MSYKISVFENDTDINSISDIYSRNDTSIDTVFHVDTISEALFLWDELVIQYACHPYCIREEGISPNRIVVGGIFDPADRRERAKILEFAGNETPDEV